jgi:hypothetical protein
MSMSNALSAATLVSFGPLEITETALTACGISAALGNRGFIRGSPGAGMHRQNL